MGEFMDYIQQTNHLFTKVERKVATSEDINRFMPKGGDENSRNN